MKLFNTLLCLAFCSTLMAQTSPIGQWKTIDDETGEMKSIVEIYEKDGKIHGKVVKLFRKAGQDPDPICDKCEKDDPRYGKKILGMVIMKDLVQDGDEYVDGTVLKPGDGKVYDCKIWREGDKLYVRGYWGFIYRTQEWVKYE